MLLTDTSQSLIDAAFLAPLREQMLKFATLQLRDSALAEDAVQEALLAALRYSDRFNGQAAVKTWVFAILKNKIIDIVRRRSRANEVSAHTESSDDDHDLNELFDAKGHWSEPGPSTWANPEAALQEQQFWRVFEACLDHLPAQQARVFMMREFIGLDTPEICSETGVTSSHLNVLLYRARMRLRECLEMRWFNGDKAVQSAVPSPD